MRLRLDPDFGVVFLLVALENLLVLSRECGNEPGEYLKGHHKGWFIGVISSFPPEHQKETTKVTLKTQPLTMCRSFPWSDLRAHGSHGGRVVLFVWFSGEPTSRFGGF